MTVKYPVSSWCNSNVVHRYSRTVNMSTIVICPKCKQINIGSKLYCVNCQTSLIGIQRIQGESPLPDYTPAPAPEKQQEENETGKPPRKIKK
jgi:hypothetical protein